jgi:serine protease Do
MDKIYLQVNRFFRKAKQGAAHAISRTALMMVLTSVITVLVTLAIVFAIIFSHRGELFAVLAEGYAKSHPQIASPNPADKIPIALIPPEAIKSAEPPAPEDTIVSAVQKANPAVVAITITKEVPKYEAFYNDDSATNPFGDLLPGFSMNQPSYKQVGTEKKVIGGGSGFLVASDGYLVTNRHVVVNTGAEYSYSVTLNSGKKYTARVLAKDQILDVAILKIDASNLPYLELGDSSMLELGQSVIAIGNALGQFKNTVSTGIISGLSRTVTAGDGQGMTESLDKVIQTDAAINPGNSGGPLLDLSGKAIGVNVAVAQGAESIGFALPINSVKSVIDQVKKTGKISRPFVGIRYKPVTAELKAQNNLSVDYGILVARGANANEPAVMPGSPAEKGGIVEGDIILAVDGNKITEDQNFTFLVRAKKVGERITLKVLSRGITKNITLTLGQATE